MSAMAVSPCPMMAMVCCSPTSGSFSQKNSPSFVSMVSFGAVASISAWEENSLQRRRKVSLRSSLAGRADPHYSHRCGKALRELRVVHSMNSAAPEPLNVMIAGAPASGKGTQCELIAEKFGLVHISAGDLLRAEVAAGTEAGGVAKEYMNEGKLVPAKIVVTMVKNRLAKPDTCGGWLLDGYPRSLEQAEALEAVGIRPHVFILLDVPDEYLVARIVGRRLDPVTGKIYHLTLAPPENEEIASRLVQRFDDKEEKVKARVNTHHANVEAVIGVYKDIVKSVDGNRPKLEVFADITNVLSTLRKRESPVS